MTRKPSKRKTQRPIEHYRVGRGRVRISTVKKGITQKKPQKPFSPDTIISRIKKEKSTQRQILLIKELLTETLLKGSYKQAKHVERELFKIGESEAAGLMGSLLRFRECLHRIENTKKEGIAKKWLQEIKEEFEKERDSFRRKLLETVLSRAEKVFSKKNRKRE